MLPIPAAESVQIRLKLAMVRAFLLMRRGNDQRYDNAVEGRPLGAVAVKQKEGQHNDGGQMKPSVLKYIPRLFEFFLGHFGKIIFSCV